MIPISLSFHSTLTGADCNSRCPKGFSLSVGVYSFLFMLPFWFLYSFLRIAEVKEATVVLREESVGLWLFRRVSVDSLCVESRKLTISGRNWNFIVLYSPLHSPYAFGLPGSKFLVSDKYVKSRGPYRPKTLHAPHSVVGLSKGPISLHCQVNVNINVQKRVLTDP